MCRVNQYILLVALLLLPMFSFGQDEGKVVDTLRSIIEPPPVYEETEREESSSFLPIDQQTPVAIRTIPDDKVQALKGDDDYWYANVEPEKKTEGKTPHEGKSKNSFLDQSWLQNLLWMIILCSFIGIVVWYLASSNIRLFRKKPKRILEEEVDKEITEDIFSIHYDREIQKAEQAGNFRLAVRLWYLKTLKELADRQIIEYRHDKTDNDYVNSLYGSLFYRDFFRLTRNFEYIWYGQFALTREAYRMMQTDFSNFKNCLT